MTERFGLLGTARKDRPGAARPADLMLGPAVGALLLLPAPGPATQAPPPVFPSGVGLVEVPVIVSDPQGRFVPDLTRADFEISERGAPQAITAFERVSIPLPPVAPVTASPPTPADPSDEERSYRAQSLYSVLEGLAGPLARVERRRKALLLFSEGVDYNLADLMGAVQRNASAVQQATERAVRALMRADVSVYAIDPRGLDSALSTTERLPPHDSPNAPRARPVIPL